MCVDLTNLIQLPFSIKKKKVAFFDAYRKLDVKLSRIIRSDGNGIYCFASALKYKGTREHDSDWYKLGCKLHEIRCYRNQLAHSKTEWKNMMDPADGMTHIVNNLSHWVDQNYYETCNIMATQKKYLDSRKKGGNR